MPQKLNPKVELHANVDVPSHLDDLREVHCLLSSFLQICDREDLQAGVVDLA